jgi:hypothetical protein
MMSGCWPLQRPTGISSPMSQGSPMTFGHRIGCRAYWVVLLTEAICRMATVGVANDTVFGSPPF